MCAACCLFVVDDVWSCLLIVSRLSSAVPLRFSQQLLQPLSLSAATRRMNFID
jgi:hypothetical protein